MIVSDGGALAYICLDKKSFFSNLNYYTRNSDKKKLIIGLKDNAYGHGIIPVEKMSLEFGLENCFVRGLADLNKLDVSSWESVLVLGSIKKNRYNRPCSNIHYTVNCISDLPFFKANDSVELKINTGMNRNGVCADNALFAIGDLISRGVNVKGVFTHFSSSDTSKYYTLKQLRIFNEICKKIRKQFPELNMRFHCSNTAASGYIKDYSATRIGIGCYGYSNMKKENVYLSPVLSLYAERMSKRLLHAGDSVGYDFRFYINSEEGATLSTFDIGYSDLHFRNSKQNQTILDNLVPVVGKVSMDSFSALIDSENLCVFSNASHLAEQANTTVYDLLVSINGEIERRVIE